MMATENVVNRAFGVSLWQDYRASDTGMAVYYGSDPISELPIREIPEKYPTEIESEPHYESGTFGFHTCVRLKIRTTFVKLRIRYLLFITKYAGTIESFKNKYFVTGFYRVTKTADVKRQHIRHCENYSCLDEKACHALQAEEVRFVSVEDAYPVTPQTFKEWGFSSRLTRQSRIILTEEQTATVVDYLRGKPDIRDKYVEETARLLPAISEKDEDEDDDE
jgi:hypothetical protein